MKDLSQATLIGTVSGIKFFEDPHFGDDCGMWAVYKGEAILTDWCDLPTEEELEGSPEAFMECYRQIK